MYNRVFRSQHVFRANSEVNRFETLREATQPQHAFELPVKVLGTFSSEKSHQLNGQV